MDLAKDPSILALLGRLNVEVHGWVVVDHWDADECAVGLAREGRPRRLVYISTFEMGPDRYAYECEEPTGPDDTDFIIVDRGAVAGMDALVKVLRHHLDKDSW